MLRFTISTCAVIAEVHALDSTGFPWMLGFAFVSLIASAVLWWSELITFADNVVGLDL